MKMLDPLILQWAWVHQKPCKDGSAAEKLQKNYSKISKNIISGIHDAERF